MNTPKFLLLNAASNSLIGYAGYEYYARALDRGTDGVGDTLQKIITAAELAAGMAQTNRMQLTNEITR